MRSSALALMVVLVGTLFPAVTGKPLPYLACIWAQKCWTACTIVLWMLAAKYAVRGLMKLAMRSPGGRLRAIAKRGGDE